MADSNVQIIPYYAHPHVHTVINDDTYYDETVAVPQEAEDLDYSTCVVAGADQGIDNTFVRLSDLTTKKAMFGNGNFQKYGQPSLQADALFNGNTNVWFCRVLPDNATYANVIILAHYRKGNILDDLGQETGKKRLEIKFSTAYASKPYIVSGAVDENAIIDVAESLTTTKADPQTGYLTVPICYIRSIGRGKYGNRYSMTFRRDSNAEQDYEAKMYKFGLIVNDVISRVMNIFSGSLYQTTYANSSTLISDVLDQFSTGTCPIAIHSFENSFQTLYDYYQSIVEENGKYIAKSGSNEDDVAEYQLAAAITERQFDPIFGYSYLTNTNEIIPYYRNYTVKQSGPYVKPDLEVPNTSGATKPLNIGDWATAKIGARVLVIADPLNNGYRWMYTVIDIDTNTGNIVYDDGVECAIDDDQYDGIDLTNNAGIMLSGGHDGDFEEITVSGVTRAPTAAEMKLLLAREYVKAFRGTKDRKILSPARINLDFIFDANYNMTYDEFALDDSIQTLYSNSTILTDADYKSLSVTYSSSGPLEVTDLNVKQAMYDLNQFRNRNGITLDENPGAGCLLHLDCGLVGSKNISDSSQINDVITMMNKFTGRNTSVDIGYYDIFDPYSGKRISVTATYFLARRLIPHLMREGLNKPFTYNYAQMTAIQRSTAQTGSNDMIRDSFRPDIDLIDWDVKEKLFKSRINYYLTSEEGRVVQRAVQNTRQMDASALLEENNVRVLNSLKKGLDKACRGYLFNWNEPETRKGYTDSQMAAYRPWIGTMVQDLQIKFEANAWEQERMIMHCYCSVKFRDIVKRIILEINIQRADYQGGE